MNILYEERLDAKARKALSDDMFGLPKERKFPLNDEEHVRKAIQLFKFCPPSKRNELAKNINRRIKELKLDISITREDIYAKRKDPKTVKESYSLTQILLPIDKPIYNDRDLREVEFVLVSNINHNLMGLDCLVSINKWMRDQYASVVSYLQYDNDCNYNMGEYDAIEELTDNIKNVIDKMLNDESYTGYIEIIDNFISEMINQHNIFHSYRKLYEVCLYTSASKKGNDDIFLMRQSSIFNKLYEVSSKLLAHIEGDMLGNAINVLYSNKSLFDMSDTILNTDIGRQMIDDTHNKIKKDLYIINTSIVNDSDDIYTPTLKDINIFYLAYITIPLKATHEITGDVSVYVSRIRGVKQVMKHNILDGTVYIATRYDEYYIILENVENKDIYLVKLDDEARKLLSGEIIPAESRPLKVTTIRRCGDSSYCPSLEGISVNEDGDIRIEISPKNSYMDSYSTNHKMLVENWKNHNYESMKKNLAYAFALIVIIERSEEYKKREPAVVKARAFAINDFKTYLKHLQSVEPDFDFVEYYSASEYDKKIINIPKTTVIGIKKLMRAILV